MILQCLKYAVMEMRKMSMPEFPRVDPEYTREVAINQIISSIAMEELGLSHIINAEGEKLQYVLGTIEGSPPLAEPASVDDLLEVNKSIHNTLESTMMYQYILKEKLCGALSAAVLQGPTGPEGRCLSSYMEVTGGTQTAGAGELFVFDPDSADSVGNNITLDSTGTVFTITRPGLYQVEWNMNIRADNSGAVVGVVENGEAASGACTVTAGSFASGTLIHVENVPFTLSLRNYENTTDIEDHANYQNSALSIRILRFADGPSQPNNP